MPWMGTDWISVLPIPIREIRSEKYRTCLGNRRQILSVNRKTMHDTFQPAAYGSQGLPRRLRSGSALSDEIFRRIPVLTAIIGCLGVLLAERSVQAQSPEAVSIRISDRLPYGQQPIDYLSPASNDPVAVLGTQLEAGAAILDFDAEHGYLPALLKALDISPTSQLLVFSKTARNQQLIGPGRPRAIYFNEEAYVGWVPGAEAIEIAAIDPNKGAMFYTLAQDAGIPPRFHRADNCLACHAGSTTLNVPGLTVRSFLTDKTGKPREGYSRVTHETEIAKRWGGWYVTATQFQQPHWGNLLGRYDERRHRDDPTYRGSLSDLSPFFDPSKYLSPHSDVVAHLVLNHQIHGQNLLIRVNYESRLGRRSDAEERLVRYLMFADEAPLEGPIAGTSRFAEWFAARGPRTADGRSLRQFDLKRRLFRYRASYLLDSKLFQQLPADARERIYRRVFDILAGREVIAGIKDIPRTQRQETFEILQATLSGLSDYWRTAAGQPRKPGG